MKPFQVAFFHATPHGVCAAIHLPGTNEPVPEAFLSELAPEESEHARTLKGYRQPEFVGGRLALRAAFRSMGIAPPTVLPDERGQPQFPAGLVGSVSHKRDLAIAMVARETDGTLGVDLEDPGPARPGIASHILRPAELALVQSLESEERQWVATLIRFSVKEAIYKALHPWVRRYVGFKEAEVQLSIDGHTDVELHLEKGEGPFVIDARFAWLHGRLLTSARIRPMAAAAVDGSP